MAGAAGGRVAGDMTSLNRLEAAATSLAQVMAWFVEWLRHAIIPAMVVKERMEAGSWTPPWLRHQHEAREAQTEKRPRVSHVLILSTRFPASEDPCHKAPARAWFSSPRLPPMES